MYASKAGAHNKIMFSITLSVWEIQCMDLCSCYIDLTVILHCIVLVNVSSLGTPSSEHVIEGDDVTLPCRNILRGPIRWLYIKSNDEPQNVIFNGESIESEYKNKITERVDKTAGDYNLLFRNVRLNQSGLYICVEDWGAIYKRTIHLNVLGKYSQAFADMSLMQSLPHHLRSTDTYTVFKSNLKTHLFSGASFSGP